MLQTELVKSKRKRKIYENTQLIILNSKVKEETLCVGEEWACCHKLALCFTILNRPNSTHWHAIARTELSASIKTKEDVIGMCEKSENIVPFIRPRTIKKKLEMSEEQDRIFNTRKRGTKDPSGEWPALTHTTAAWAWLKADCEQCVLASVMSAWHMLKSSGGRNLSWENTSVRSGCRQAWVVFF